MNLKPALVAGMLAIGVSVSAVASAPAANTADESLKWRAEVSHPGCRGETEPWLPGALQIEGRAQTTLPTDAGQETLRATTRHDCALV